jgi:hypothetical protein
MDDGRKNNGGPAAGGGALVGRFHAAVGGGARNIGRFGSIIFELYRTIRILPPAPLPYLPPLSSLLSTLNCSQTAQRANELD